MKFSALFLLATALLAACQSDPQPAEAEEPVVAVSNRPDPQNPAAGNGAFPSDWEVRLDRPDAEAVIGANADSSDLFFVNMVPGWHVTTGPAAIFYHPENTAAGQFEASMGVHLFDPGDRTEAFGLIFGGQHLDAENQTYDYFLIRNSGEFLIKRRIGENTQLIEDWTPSDAIVKYENTEESSVLNVLKVRVDDANATFLINDTVVATHPKDHVNTEGLVGMRINHGLNVHVSNLAVASL